MSKREVIEEVLVAIYKEDGTLTPEAILERARLKDHPLHAEFDWDNKVAGERWRLHQAEEMIRTVEVRIIQGDEEYKVRAFHPMRYVGRDTPGYVHESDITPTERPLLLRNMEREWTAMKRRYGHMSEFWQLVAAN